MGISGKCDFEDTCVIFGEDNIIKGYNIFLGNTVVPLKIETHKDLVAFYPFLVGLMCGKGLNGTIQLSDRSYIDQEEEQWMTNKLEELVRYYKRCKRRKEPYDKSKALSLITWPPNNDVKDYHMELVNRVAEKGDKATIEDLHDGTHERMREEWYNVMLQSGWDEMVAYSWVYGWPRLFQRERETGGDYVWNLGR